MPNSLGPTGLTTATQSELYTSLSNSLKQIYGSDINLDSDSPDGQMLNIFIQTILDVLDLTTQVYNMFDPDQAVGVVLDQRVAINGIQRQAGTFTVTNITITTSQAVTLYGLDQSTQPVYTVSDNAGNQWQLQTTQYVSGAGSFVYAFQAAVAGAQLTVPNTITTPVTVVLGVTSVNNPTTYTTLGINEETDAALRVRRQQSVSLASQGYLPSLVAALENITGVTGAFVYENNSGSTNSDGVPAHSIWVIVGGSPADSDVANAIYQKRNAGCGLFGSTSYNITQINGVTFTVFWDFVSQENLFIYFNASSIDGINPPNISAIKTGLPTSLIPSVDQEININNLATLVQQIDPNTLVTNAGFSNGYTQAFTLSGVSASGTFVISYNGNSSSSINWNDSAATIQTKIQAISGLSTATVTGSIASQILTFDLSSIKDVLSLLTVSSNSLQTSGATAITFSYNENYSNTLSPVSKKYQFQVSQDNIIILPMILSPTSTSVVHSSQQQFAGLGGYGTLTYSFQTNNSGGTINSTSGLYTAGSTTSVTDTILVTDAMGNTATASASVT